MFRGNDPSRVQHMEGEHTMKKYIISIEYNVTEHKEFNYECITCEELDEAIEYVECFYEYNPKVNIVRIYREASKPESIPGMRGWKESSYKPIIYLYDHAWYMYKKESWENIPYLYKQEHKEVKPTFCYTSSITE